MRSDEHPREHAHRSHFRPLEAVRKLAQAFLVMKDLFFYLAGELATANGMSRLLCRLTWVDSDLSTTTGWNGWLPSRMQVVVPFLSGGNLLILLCSI